MPQKPGEKRDWTQIITDDFDREFAKQTLNNKGIKLLLTIGRVLQESKADLTDSGSRTSAFNHRSSVPAIST